MKRNKIIRLLANYIYELNVDPEECDEIADKILKDIEKAGMLPPPLEIAGYGVDMDEVLVSDAQGHVYLKRSDFFQWEDENEA